MSKLPTCGHWVPGEDGPVLTPVPGCHTCRDATPPPKRPRCVACQRPIDTSRHHVVLSTSVQVIEVSGPPDQATPADEDDEHGPWTYTEFGTLCFCGYPVDSDERCTRPRTLRGRLDALTGKLFEAADNLLTEFDRAGRTDGAIESSMDDLRAVRDELSEFWETNRAALAGNAGDER